MFNNLKQPNTRNLVIQYLSLKYFCCDELSDALHLTKPDIQYHLRELVSQGVIKEIEMLEENGKRGRPKKYYHINKSTQPLLTSDLQKLLILSLDRQGHDNRDLIETAIHTIFGKPPESTDYIFKIRQLIGLLNDHHYQSRWEIHRDGIVISFRVCPYMTFCGETQFFCNLDKALLEKFTGLRLISHTCQNYGNQFQCSFLIN